VFRKRRCAAGKGEKSAQWRAAGGAKGTATRAHPVSTIITRAEQRLRSARERLEAPGCVARCAGSRHLAARDLLLRLLGEKLNADGPGGSRRANEALSE